MADTSATDDAPDIEVVVFDILGTMVDEPDGLRTALRDVAPARDEAAADQLLAVWHEHVDQQRQHIAQGTRAYANSATLDREAAQRVAEHVGLSDAPAIERLAASGQRLAPWDDSAAGLARLTQRFPVLGLSNASRATLLRLNAYAGLHWHLVLSAEEARAYKPAPEVYQLALDAAGCPPERMLMVAAHAWDLRGAQALGMRTAYVERPIGEPPTRTDTFDWHANNLDDLVSQLTRDPAPA